MTDEEIVTAALVRVGLDTNELVCAGAAIALLALAEAYK